MNDRERIDKGWKQFGGEVGQYCRFCEDRYVGCHAECEKYQEAKQRHEDFKETVYRAKDKEMSNYRYKIEKIKRENRKSKWKGER